MKKLYFIFLTLIFINVSYSQFPKYLYGTISYYGDEFKGKPTASGQIFDPNKYTAAHKELPFGTEILVENLENGRKVKLIINDRGPFVANRVLDVSKIAAEELGFLRKGTTYAKITILKIGDNKVTSLNSEKSDNASMDSYTGDYSSNQEEFVSTSLKTPKASETLATAITSSTSPSLSTNIVLITKTNQIFITNVVTIPITNVIEIPPYTDKIVEKPLSETSSFSTNPDEEFILEEPKDIPPLPQYVSAASSFSSSSSFEIIEEEKEAIIDFEVSVSNTNSTTIQLKPTLGIEGGKYFIQIGAFIKEENAIKIYDLLRKDNYPVFTIEEFTKGRRWVKVRVGYFSSKEKAEAIAKKLEKYKVKGLILSTR